MNTLIYVTKFCRLLTITDKGGREYMDFEIIAVLFFVGGCLALGLILMGVKIHAYFNRHSKK